MRVKRVQMKPLLTIAQASAFTALALITLPAMTCAYSWDDQDGKPRNSYERQQETYRQHGYDTRQNGPLPETIAEERRRQEQRQREADDQQRWEQRQQDQDRKHRSGY